jgi:ABC-type glycerol-3-phosphate transport system permease component
MATTVKPWRDGQSAAQTFTWPRIRRLCGVVFVYALVLTLCAFILLPLGWMLTAALKPDRVPIFTVPTEWFPSQYWHWENFARALTAPSRPFLRYTLNTLIIVFGNIVGTLLSCSLVAYPFARLRFRGSTLLFNIVIITLLIPWQVLMIPQFLLFFNLGWYGTYLPLIVPSFTAGAFYVFLIRQYMRTFPRELDDASRIDGCNHFQTFWHIILPLCVPVLAVCAVFVFLGSWNDLLGPLIYLDSNEKFTVAIGMANFVTRANTPWNLLMAANIVMMLPVVIIYFFAQDKLIGGIASVGLKG